MGMKCSLEEEAILLSTRLALQILISYTWNRCCVVINKLVGFGRACAPVRCAHPSSWAHCHVKRGAARPPSPPIAASLFLILPPKIYEICRTWAAHVKGLFLSTGTQRLWNMMSTCPPIPNRSFLLSFSISSYSSLLILLVGAILRLLFLLLLYFKLLFVDLQTCILMIYVHISVILRGFSKGPSLFYLLILLYCTLFFLFLFFSSYI